MVTGENYLDPFECYSCGLPDSQCICGGDDYDSEDYRPADYDIGEYRGDDDGWGCEFGDRCLMPSYNHRRDECYTVEMAEEWEGENRQQH